MPAIAQIGRVHLFISKVTLSRSPEFPRWETLKLDLAHNYTETDLSGGVLSNSPVRISVAIDREIKPEWTEFYGYLSLFNILDGDITSLVFNLMEMPA